MRLIHTSDWHLGQYFFNKSRKDEHQAFLSWLLQQVDHHQVDAIVVAGDIFDTGSPPSYARQMYNQFIVDLQQHNCQLIVIGGNHDSVATLNESTNLLKCLNTNVVPGVAKDVSEQVFVINDKSGAPGAVICAIPYIRPRDVLNSTAGQSAADKKIALQQAIAEHYQHLFDIAVETKSAQTQPLPIVATGHLMTVGSSKTDSVRDIYIGTLDAFPASEFPNADYIALGHMHRSQKVMQSEHIVYCGSPIPLSFDEIGQQKKVMLVDFEQDRLQSVNELEIPVFQPMQMIKGSLSEIENQLQQLKEHDDHRAIWLDIEVITDDYLTDLHSRVEQMAEALPVEILLLRRQRKRGTRAIESDNNKTLNELNAYEVFDKRLALESFETTEDKTRLERIKETFSEVEKQASQKVREGLSL